jgi:hypothetical protein
LARLLFAAQPEALTQVLAVVQRGGHERLCLYRKLPGH